MFGLVRIGIQVFISKKLLNRDYRQVNTKILNQAALLFT